MEQNQLQFSDVSKNKEKFEYEMTEVALRLRGEFSKLSGKDLQLKEGLLDVQRPNIETKVAQVQAAPFTPTHKTGSVPAPGSLKELPALHPEKPNVAQAEPIHVPNIPQTSVGLTGEQPILRDASVKIPVIGKPQTAAVPEKAPALKQPGDLAKRLSEAVSAEVHCGKAPEITYGKPVSFSAELPEITSTATPPELPEAPAVADFEAAMQDILDTAAKQYKS